MDLPGAGVTGKCERPDMAAEVSLGPLEDQCIHSYPLNCLFSPQESNLFLKNIFELK